MYGIILAIALVATAGVQTYKVFDLQAKEGQAKAMATTAMTYSKAVQRYIDDNYNTLVFLEKTTITPDLLRDKGLLKSWFPDANSFGEPYTTEVIAKPTPSGKVILEAVIGIGSDKISQDMNRYLATATGSAMAGQTINGKMYGNNGTYTMDATKDLSKYGNVQIVVKSLGNAMQDIKLAPAIASVSNMGSGGVGSYIMPTVPAPVYPPECPGGVCPPWVKVDPVTHVVTVDPATCASNPSLPGCPTAPTPPTTPSTGTCTPGVDCGVGTTPTGATASTITVAAHNGALLDAIVQAAGGEGATVGASVFVQQWIDQGLLTVASDGTLNVVASTADKLISSANTAMNGANDTAATIIAQETEKLKEQFGSGYITNPDYYKAVMLIDNGSVAVDNRVMTGLNANNAANAITDHTNTILATGDTTRTNNLGALVTDVATGVASGSQLNNIYASSGSSAGIAGLNAASASQNTANAVGVADVQTFAIVSSTGFIATSNDYANLVKECGGDASCVSGHASALGFSTKQVENFADQAGGGSTSTVQ